MQIDTNKVRRLIDTSDTEPRLIGWIGGNLQTIASIFWDGAQKIVYLQFEKDIKGQVTCVGNNNSFSSDHPNFSYRNNMYEPLKGDKFYLSNPLEPVLHNDFWLKNGSIFLDEDNTVCYSFDFNITVNSNNTYQLLSQVDLIEK